MHEEVTSDGKDGQIYDSGTLFDSLKGHRKLSLMKQENIRIAIKNNASLSDLKAAIHQRCGYCFKYQDDSSCQSCPLVKKIGTICTEDIYWEKMKKVKTIKEFAAAHKSWCKKLGLWQEGWK